MRLDSYAGRCELTWSYGRNYHRRIPQVVVGDTLAPFPFDRVGPTLSMYVIPYRFCKHFWYIRPRNFFEKGVMVWALVLMGECAKASLEHYCFSDIRRWSKWAKKSVPQKSVLNVLVLRLRAMLMPAILLRNVGSGIFWSAFAKLYFLPRTAFDFFQVVNIVY